jgi:tripartite-type tricarboxylate transporter receptor subunit TctC
MAPFGHRQQRMRRPALESDICFDARPAAGLIEGTAGYEAGIQHKQRVGGELGNLDCSALAERRRRAIGGKQVYDLQRVARKARIAWRNRAEQILAKMNLAALEHSQGVGPRNCLPQLHQHVGVTLRVSVQEIGNGAFDELRGGCHLQRPGVAPPQQLRALADRAGVVQQTAAIDKQLLAFAGQHEAPSHTIEELETELLLEIAYLPGESRLGNAQVHCRLGNGAQLGDGDESSRVPKIHDSLLMPYQHYILENICIGRMYCKYLRFTRERCAPHPSANCEREDVMKHGSLLLLPALGLGLATMEVRAEAWPTKPLRVIVPIGAGSVADIVPRVVFEQLTTQLGQHIVVDNRPGAGQTIGAGVVAKSAPDGYTLLVNSSAHAIAPSLHPNLNYHPARDFAAVAPLGVSPFVIVVPPARGFKTVRELVAAAKVKPGAFNFSSPGVATASHLSAERFRFSAGVEAVHVPFKGGVEAMTEVMAGRIDFFFVVIGAAVPNIQSGKLNALAVNGARRSAALPEVPTVREAGFANAEYPTWFGLFAPAKTPRQVIDQLHRETLKALQEPKVRDKLAALGVDPMVMTPKEFDAHVQQDIAINAELVKAIGLKPQ